MLKNNKGFTLIEILVAMSILLIGMLALLNSTAVMIQHNLGNILRDEAVRIAEENMSNLKNTPFDSLASSGPTTVTRTFRGISKNYTVNITVSSPGGAADTKTLEVAVTWTHKGQNLQHSITSMVNR